MMEATEEEAPWSYSDAELDAWEAELCGEGGLSYATQASSSSAKNVKKRLNMEIMPGLSSHLARNDAERAERSSAYDARGEKGREERATTEQVLDPRTRLVLFKLLSNDVFESIDGCLSTGKEANVYFARRGASLEDDPSQRGKHLAVKVFKTSILVFRDRSAYIDGEHRFRRGYSRGKNPRKMVKLWAEKELRNYRRLAAGGVPAPTARFVKGNVLVTDFLGSPDGWPAPRLKDVALTTEQRQEAYWQTCRAMRAMFARCRLVHADLSEFNLLWHDDHVVVIDVSQSVEHDHPRALDFLRNDCKNVHDFFTAVDPMPTSDLFDFVTSLDEPFATDDDLDAALSRRLHSRRHRTGLEQDPDEAVFMGTFLPRSLHELGASGITCEKEQTELSSGRREAAYERAVAGLLGQQQQQESRPEDDPHEEEDDDDDDDDGGSADQDASEDEAPTMDEGATGRLPNDPETRAIAKQRKRAATKVAKEARAEKRKTKLKKHLKKKAVSRSKA